MKIKQKQKIIKINKIKQKQNITDYSLHMIIREALPKIFPKNRNTQRKGTKKDGSKSILYEVKKKCRKSPKEPFNEHQCNKTKNGRKGIYTRTRHDQPRLQN
jgi:hypothetical protein